MIKCPKCKIKYKKVKTIFESQGVILKSVEAYKCLKCGEEIFSPEQTSAIRQRIEQFASPLTIERKVSSAAGKKPVIYMPQEILSKVGIHIGDVVKIGIEGKKKVVIAHA